MTTTAVPPTAPRAARRLRLGGAEPRHVLLAVFLYAFFAVFMIWPIVQIVAGGFVRRGGGVTLDYVRLVFQRPRAAPRTAQRRGHRASASRC